MRIVLALSLTLNLLAVGLAAGVFWRHGGLSDHRPPSLAMALYRALPETDRGALRHTLRERRERADPRRVAELAAVTEALRARPFDPAAFEALLLRHEKARVDRQEAMRRAYLSRLATMDDAARNAYADRVQRFAAERGRRSSHD
ncbi:periplasmic heavy metal sensor [Ruegeria marina]|uniref:Heavy-metal resistance n=1 Tax=Ruegeria marina TaxID=639004 RepID=A0A1G6VDQ6_9RHOB|nr:periplasmic heavy metal sensor [Ruegeria marina]SDD51604.1 Heavy-metal resistance [Ruegeria marina]